MANHVIKDPPEFSDALRKLEVSDPNHANTFNPLFEKLINNDVFLKAFTEALSASLGEVGEDVASVQQALDSHLADDAKHITAQERNNWNSKQDALPVENRRKITFGTADPVGGEDGDIYFQYE